MKAKSYLLCCTVSILNMTTRCANTIYNSLCFCVIFFTNFAWCKLLHFLKKIVYNKFTKVSDHNFDMPFVTFVCFFPVKYFVIFLTRLQKDRQDQTCVLLCVFCRLFVWPFNTKKQLKCTKKIKVVLVYPGKNVFYWNYISSVCVEEG